MPTVRFLQPNGELLKQVEAPAGTRLLELAHAHDIPIEGACEGSMACSTCHVILDVRDFGRFGEPSDAEEDMLDFAYGVSATSRLSCQVSLVDSDAPIDVRLPAGSTNLMHV